MTEQLTKPERNPEVVWRDLEGEVVIYDPDSNLSFVLNPLAAVLWQLLDGEHSLDEQFADLSQAVDIGADELAASFGEVVAHWEANGLIREGTA